MKGASCSNCMMVEVGCVNVNKQTDIQRRNLYSEGHVLVYERIESECAVDVMFWLFSISMGLKKS